MDPLVTTTRLALHDWSDDDAPAALAIYGSGDVARWLTPVSYTHLRAHET